MQKKSTSDYSFARRIMSMVLVVAMVLGIVIQYSMPTQAAILTSADADTSLGYDDDNFLGHEYSTEFAGRIWSDKSVEEAENNTFNVKYSVLATSKSVTGQTNAPVDVVFVIDISGSMADPMSSSDNTKRITAATDALNQAIDKVLSMNPYTRVGVVAFSEGSAELLALGRYDKGTRTTGYGKNQTTITNYFSASTGNTHVLYRHVKAEGDNRNMTAQRNVTGGTNIQLGYYLGLKMLADSASTTVNVNGTEMNRVPALVFLSDGAPTYSSESDSWWAPNQDHNDGPGSNPRGYDQYFIGNGFKALLNAAYMKDRVNDTYAEDVSIYTVGMGISALEDAEKDLAYVTLAPNNNWNNNNKVASDFRSAWATYVSGRNFTVNVGRLSGYSYYNSDYTVTHPTSGDIRNNVDALKNLVAGYYDADDTNALLNVFNQIVADIALNTSQVPTEIKTGQTLEAGGFVTYSDPIGQYMEVKGTTMTFNFEGTNYTASDADKDGVYTFANDAKVKGSDGKEYSLNSISITLNSDADGNQILEVKIPAILIPLRVNEVTLNAQGQVTSHTHNGELPCTLTYTVGLIDEVYDQANNSIYLIPSDANGAWSGEKLQKYQSYVAANTDAVTGNVHFYSNLYTGEYTIINNKTGQEHTVGNAIVTFEPAHDNPFYYIQEKMHVYLDEAMTRPATAALDDDTTYYYKEVYYQENDVITKAVARTGAQLKAVAMEREANGQWYRVPGTVRLNKLQLFEKQKNPNVSGTAQDFYASEYIGGTGQDGYFHVHLGNNGVLKAKVNGNLEISKIVTAAAGHQSPDKEFTFTVDFIGATGTYDYVIRNANGTQSSAGTISDGGTLVLKHGQKAEIVNLPYGAEYEITEAAVAGFTTTSTNAKGTIVPGDTAAAVFTNHYDTEEITVNEGNTTDDFGVKKVLTGRPWNGNDSYTFILESNRATTPMPANSTPVPNAANPTHYLKEVTVTTADEFAFGEIVFDRPGTFTYTISERVATPGIPGISYSGAMYQVVVVVTDNGDGTLSKNVTMSKLRNDQGTDDNVSSFTGTTAEFENIFSTDQVEWIPVGTKDYADNAGTLPLKNGMFSFTISANSNSPANTPLPASAVNGVSTEQNVGPQIPYDAIIFTKDHIASSEPGVKTSYLYDFKEVIPAGAVYDAVSGNYTLDGMTYDGRTIQVKVDVYYNEKMDIVVEPHYPTMVDGISYNRVVFFNKYIPEEVEIDIVGDKVLEGREWKDTDTFGFLLSTNDQITQNAIKDGAITGVNAADMSQLAAVTVTKADQDFAFENIMIATPGTYKFQVSEIKNNIPGVEYDAHIENVTVVVTDDIDSDGTPDGKLVATVTYDADGAVFTNVYDTENSDPLSLTGTKTLFGRDMKANEFFINVEPLNNAPMGNSRANNAVPAAKDGVASAPVTLLNRIVYSAPGTYQYLITENVPSDAQKLGGIKYDENTVYRVTVEVIDNTNGKLEAAASVEKSIDKGQNWTDVTANDIKFENHYSVSSATYTPLHLWKDLQGKDLEAGEFTFKLEELQDEVDGMILPAVTEVSNLATGEIIFDDVTFTKPGVYQVQITEVIPDTKNPGMTYSTNEVIVQFTVTDNGYGQLEIQRSLMSGDMVFTNEYNAKGELDLDIVKVLKDNKGNDLVWQDDYKFTFEIQILDEATQDAVESGAIVFPTLNDDIVTLEIAEDTENHKVTSPKIVFTEEGTYKFIIREVTTDPIPGITYDTNVHEVEIVVTDEDHIGTLTVTPTGGRVITFTNVYDPGQISISGHDYLGIQKKFTGRENDEWLSKDEFTFKLEAADENTQKAIEIKDVVLSSKTSTETLTVNKGNKDHAHFGDIVFNAAGTYTFYITEVVPENVNDGIVYDTAEPRKVIINVIDEGGMLAAYKNSASDLPVFNNEYVPADVQITKAQSRNGDEATIDRLTVRENDEVTYYLTITNNGKGTASTIKVYDKIPYGLTLKDVPDGATLHTREDGNYLGWSKDELVAGESWKVSFTVIVPEVVADQANENGYVEWANTGVVYYKQPGEDPDVLPSTREDSNEVEIQQGVPEVTIEKLQAVNDGAATKDRMEVEAGDKVTYTLKISNTGTEVAEKLVITDAVPALLTVDEDSISHEGALDKGTITWEIDEIKAGEYVEVQFTVTVPAVTAAQAGEDRIYIWINFGKVTYENNPVEPDEIIESNPVIIEEPYSAQGKLTLSLAKDLNGREWIESDKFTFELSVTDKATLQAIQNGVVDFTTEILRYDLTNGENVSSPDITFTMPGEYKFTVKEIQGQIPGVTYDTAPKTVTVTVTDTDTPGVLAATSDYADNTVVITNTYKPSEGELAGLYNLGVDKTLTGRENDAWLDKDVFNFTLTAGDETTQSALDKGKVVLKGATLQISATNKDSAHFGDIVFYEAGTYTFKVSESAGTVGNGITYDTKDRVIVVNVVDNPAEGVLVATLDESASDPLEFTNVYTPANLTIVKTQAVNNDPATTVPLEVREDNVVTYTLTIKNDSEETAHNIEIFDEVPEGLTVIAESISDGGKIENGVLNWNIGDLEAGKSKTVSFRVNVPEITADDADENGYVRWTNMATVQYHQPGEDPEDPKTTEESNEVEILEGVPEVVIEKRQSINGGAATKDTLKVENGDTITYTINVTNNGTEEADNIVITDTVPNGLTVKAINNNGVLANGVITWNIGTIAEKASVSVSFTVEVVSVEGEFTKWTNIANVDYPNDPEDPDDSDDDPSNPVTVYDSMNVYLVGKKNMDISEGSNHKMGTYSFTISPVTDGAPMPAVTTVSNDANGDIQFGPIVFDREGLFIYKISEVGAGETINGETYDSNVYYAVVKVTEVIETIVTNESTTEETTVVDQNAVDSTEVDSNEVDAAAVDTTEDSGTGEEISVAVSYEVESVTYHKNDQNANAEQSFTFVNSYDDADVVIIKTQALNDGEPTTEKLLAREENKVTYFLTVKNNGNGVASNLVITDEVPAGLIIDETSISDGGKLENGTITWTIAALAAGAEQTVKFNVTVPEVKEADDVDKDGYVEWENTASVVYNNPDDPSGDDPEEDEPDEPVVVEEGIPEISIKKLQKINEGTPTNQQMSVVEGDIVTYMITVSNSGTEVAENVDITDAVPNGLTVVDGSISDDGKLENGTISWLIESIPAGENITVTFKVEVPDITAEQAGEDKIFTWENIAYVMYENDPEDPTDPEPSDPVVIEEGIPEVIIQKLQSVNDGELTMDKEQVEAGDRVTYVLRIVNIGTEDAKNVEIRDAVPAGLEVLDASITKEGKLTDGVIEWKFEELSAGEEREVQFTVVVPSVTAEQTGEDYIYTWENIAEIVYTNNPEDPEDPEESNPVEIEERIPELTINKLQAVNGGEPTTETLNVVEGDKVTYWIVIRNTGVADAENIVISDAVPNGLTVNEATISNNGKLVDGVVTWNIDSLEAGEELTVFFVVTVPNVTLEEAGEDRIFEWKNIAEVIYENDPEDPDTPEESNPVVIEEEIPLTPPQVTIQKLQAVNGGQPTTDKQSVKSGNRVTYFFVITNAGEQAAAGLIVEDILPEGLKLVEGSISNGGIYKDGKIIWNIAEVAGVDADGNNGTMTLSFTVEVPNVSKTTVWKNVGTFVYENDPEDPETPEKTNEVELEQIPPVDVSTGDSANAQLYSGLALISMAAMAVMVFVKKRFFRYE